MIARRTDEIVWQDPPPSKHQRWQNFARELKKSPGRWALARSANNPGPAYSRLKELGLEVTGRKTAYGWDIYARWPEES